MVPATDTDRFQRHADHVTPGTSKSNVGRNRLPFTEDCKGRAGKRGMFNIVGCLLFVVLYLVLPKSMYPYIGMIGGIGVGYSAGYAWQTAFNTFGALSIASGLFGMPAAVLLRIGANVFGAVYTMVLNTLGDKLVQYMWVRKKAEI